MLENCDGIYINSGQITSCIPCVKITASGQYWYIKFIVFEREFDGKSKFDTEEECFNEIEKIFNEDGEDDDVSNEIGEDINNRLVFLENRVSEFMYERMGNEECDNWDIGGL